jgi:cellulose/xylan binding protein with CBM9 domain
MCRTFVIVTALVVVISGCVERTSTYATAEKSDKVAEFIKDRAPQKIEHRLDADFDGKLMLLGYDLVGDKVKPGGIIKVTWYWQVKAVTGPGWRLFTHVLDANEKSRINRDKIGPIRKNFQPEHWKPGMFIQDIQEIKLPNSWDSDAVDLRVGLWKEQDRMPVTGKFSDDRNRVKGPRVGSKKAAVKTEKIEVPRAEAEPVIDGKFSDEIAWGKAVLLRPFGNTMSGEPVDQTTEVRVMWNDDKLFVAMRGKDDHLESKYTKHDDELWREDAFEIFLDPNGDKKDYFELQVSPAGVVFDSHLPAYRKNQNGWNSGMVAAVVLDGTLNDDSDTDKSWTAELAIPLKSLGAGGGIPPKVNDTWRGNFFRVDKTKEKPIYSAWSPPLRGDFHALNRFGKIVFK